MVRDALFVAVIVAIATAASVLIDGDGVRFHNLAFGVVMFAFLLVTRRRRRRTGHVR